MKAYDGQIQDLKIIELSPFYDNRGSYLQLYSDIEYNHILNYPVIFLEDDLSISHYGVLRGLHGDFRTSKLVQCLHGMIQHVVVDIRKSSKTFGKFEEFILDGGAQRQIFVPSGCVQGYLCLSDMCLFWYKQSTYYEGADKQVTIAWNDPTLCIPWRVDIPIVSDRDKNGMLLKDYCRTIKD